METLGRGAEALQPAPKKNLWAGARFYGRSKKIREFVHRREREHQPEGQGLTGGPQALEPVGERERRGTIARSERFCNRIWLHWRIATRILN